MKKKDGRGRPKIKNMNVKRDIPYCIRVSKEEKELLTKAAMFTGCTTSTAMREEGLKWARRVVEEAERGESPFPF